MSCLFKGTVSRNFLPQVFFMNHLAPSPLIITLGSFRIFSKIRGDIRKSRCTTGVNDTGGKFANGINNTGGKFATGINNTGGKFCHRFPLCCWHRWQICHRCQRYRLQICRRCQRRREQYQAADTWKWTWMQKFLYMFPLLPKGDQTKLLKFFWLKIFSICHRCRWHRWQTFSCEYLREFSKKFETVLMEYSGAGGKLIRKKNQKQKISWHCPFKKQKNMDLLMILHNSNVLFCTLYRIPHLVHSFCAHIVKVTPWKSLGVRINLRSASWSIFYAMFCIG